MDFFHTTLDLAFKGGFFMIPLVIVAIVTVGIVVERLLYLRENEIDWDRFHFELKSALRDNDLDRGIVLAAKTKGIIGRVMGECLLRVQAGRTDIEKATEKEILSEMSSMERSRGWLGTMIQIAPLLGLLGTVQGMIIVFMKIEGAQTMDPHIFAGGIYTKLITTFTGLIIAVPAAVAQEHIRRRINKILHYLDLYLLEVRDWTMQKNGPQAAASVAPAKPIDHANPIASPGLQVPHGLPLAGAKERIHA
jgi:biopolymer transport protein ExbB